MFPDSFVTQLLLFAIAQGAAWGNMLTGRFPLGFVGFALTFMLADVLLVLRFIERVEATTFFGWLLAFQTACLVASLEFFGRRLWCRLPAFRKRQEAGYRAALDAFMAGRDDEALRGFRRLFRRDPWDAEAACMIATVLAGAGRHRRARWWFGRARMRARTAVLRDEIDEEVRWLTTERRRSGMASIGRRDQTSTMRTRPRNRAAG
jgi:hypothetical protein